ncbi:MAG: methylenetetrahydrofolate--tRNA-(uracil(54)-C(5))-methyltransferase (FADH(2)-oxidizing) TrmFO [Ruminococcaceae bacterium]|nr:methylenetetrahydrofolate--tRNA-(uracil(54)-C(5))-methyltransferase (FADH(2)-oxidizing) TrmFO [Oscillospiraceae bacterium]
MKVKIIGAGLAGCEAAWQLANAGICVELYEQKPEHYSPAHSMPTMAELVCSNSLRAAGLENAVGLLKEEMRILGSLIMECADATQVPAGGALAVDREKFSQMVSDKIASHPNITVISEKVTSIPQDGYTVIATGPLTEGELYEDIRNFFGDGYLHFFDAAAPIVERESIDMSKAYFAARYGKGGADYINCPMTKEEYTAFYNELINAETAPVHGADEGSVFEGCMPVETMAKRGEDTLLFGPLKPVGLEHPETRKLPYAVVQLRQDNTEATLYNIVGFQTRLKFGEQKRVFSMIPGLEDASFVRYGVMHRNTFINSPNLLDCYYRTLKNDKVFFAGQITGVEGYIESASSGLLAGFNLARHLNGAEMVDFPITTAIGALAHYISGGSTGKFQPMNINFGIMESLGKKIKNKKEKNLAISQRAIDTIKNIISKG